MSLTLQETFDRVAAHLLTQNRPAMGENGRDCRYRSHNGDKCAVGCLIPDDKYSPSFEGFIVGEAYFAEKAAEKDRDNLFLAKMATACRQLDDVVFAICPDFGFLRKLQKIHDDVPVKDWATRLKRLAKDYSLSFAVVEEFNPLPAGDQASPVI